MPHKITLRFTDVELSEQHRRLFDRRPEFAPTRDELVRAVSEIDTTIIRNVVLDQIVAVVELNREPNT